MPLPPTDSPLAGEKIAQAIDLLQHFNDVWLTLSTRRAWSATRPST
jgi:hypothetical protein